LAHNNLAKILAADSARLPDAIAHFEAAIRINPDQADAHFNLANAFAKIPSKRVQAIAHYEATLRINPDQADAHNNYGILLATDSITLKEAIGHFESALRISGPAVRATYPMRSATIRRHSGSIPTRVVFTLISPMPLLKSPIAKRRL